MIEGEFGARTLSVVGLTCFGRGSFRTFTLSVTVFHHQEHPKAPIQGINTIIVEEGTKWTIEHQ